MNCGEFLVPNLLPDVYPVQDLQRFWRTILPNNRIEQGRVYQFSFLPIGFFSRVIVRLMNVQFIEGVLFWKNGALLMISSTKQIAKLNFDEKAVTLTISVRLPYYDGQSTEEEELDSSSSSSTITFMLLRLIVDEIETLLECFYPRLVEVTKRFIPCTHCSSLRKSHPNITPYLFTVEEVMNSVTNGDYYLFCYNITSPSRMVKIEELAPDISFADLPKINSSELSISSELGEGSFGKIFKGNWNGIDVAVKTMKTSVQGIDRSKFYEFQQECFLMRFIFSSINNYSSLYFIIYLTKLKKVIWITQIW